MIYLRKFMLKDCMVYSKVTKKSNGEMFDDTILVLTFKQLGVSPASTLFITLYQVVVEGVMAEDMYYSNAEELRSNVGKLVVDGYVENGQLHIVEKIDAKPINLDEYNQIVVLNKATAAATKDAHRIEYIEPAEPTQNEQPEE